MIWTGIVCFLAILLAGLFIFSLNDIITLVKLGVYEYREKELNRIRVKKVKINAFQYRHDQRIKYRKFWATSRWSLWF